MQKPRYQAVYFDDTFIGEDGERRISEDCGHWHFTYSAAAKCGLKTIAESFDIIRRREINPSHK